MIHIFLDGYEISEIRKKVVQFFNRELGLTKSAVHKSLAKFVSINQLNKFESIKEAK